MDKSKRIGHNCFYFKARNFVVQLQYGQFGEKKTVELLYFNTYDFYYFFLLFEICIFDYIGTSVILLLNCDMIEQEAVRETALKSKEKSR